MIDKRFTDPVGYLRDEAIKIGDGVSLASMAHPVSPWYRCVWLWLRGSRLSPDSLETIEIDIDIDIEEPQSGDDGQGPKRP